MVLIDGLTDRAEGRLVEAIREYTEPVDVVFHLHGSVVVLDAKTETARDWIEENCGDDQNIYWRSHLVVGLAYAVPIYEALEEAGYSLKIR